MGCDVQLTWKCLFTCTFIWRAILTSKVGQTDLVLVCNQGSLVGLRKQVRQNFDQLILLAQPAELIIWSGAENGYGAENVDGELQVQLREDGGGGSRQRQVVRGLYAGLGATKHNSTQVSHIASTRCSSPLYSHRKFLRWSRRIAAVDSDRPQWSLASLTEQDEQS